MKRRIAALAVAAACMLPAAAADYNQFGLKWYTIETAHFRINYHEGVEQVARETGDILERLYTVYTETYHLVLPDKTDVLVSNDDYGGGWASDIANLIHIWANAFEWNLRGTHDWLEDVVTHEYAHIISISASHKLPPWMPLIQFGYFSHPNDSSHGLLTGNTIGTRLEAHRLLPLEILPPWFFEGIAQYESSRHGGDRWDSHRDMILRTMVLSNRMQSWDHMSVFTGRGDDFEKTYNQGFSLVKYVSETYGYEKVVSILDKSSKVSRLNFDRSIREVLDMSGRELYEEWKGSLKKRYTGQIASIGTQVYGRKINPHGFENYWPRFFPDDSRIYFLSNGKADSFRKRLVSYSKADTSEGRDSIRMEMPMVGGFYDIHDASRTIVFSSSRSLKSRLSPDKGGWKTRDLFLDSLPPEKKTFRLFTKKRERQITRKQGMFHGAFSPDGDRIVCSRHCCERFYLCITDTAAGPAAIVYPPKNDKANVIRTIFSLDWSPDGRSIAVSFIDTADRKIGIYDTLSKTFSLICNTAHDERDPRFGHDGRTLYFSSSLSPKTSLTILPTVSKSWFWVS